MLPLRKGVGLFETTLSTIVSLMFVAGLLQQIDDAKDMTKSSQIALKMKTVSQSVDTYVRNNQRILSNNMGPDQIILIPMTGQAGPFANMSSLENSGVLPYNYDVRLPNGQQIAALVKKVPSDVNRPEHLESMTVSYGGMKYSDRVLGLIAQKLGQYGGAVMTERLPKTPAGAIQGTYGTWQYESSNWSASQYTPLPGHTVAYDGSVTDTTSTWLDRYYTGDPEANRMHTDIDNDNYSYRNTNTLDGVKGQTLTISSNQGNNHVYMPSILSVCQNNPYGCGLQITSPNTEITNPGDGWTTLYDNQNGLAIENPGSLSNLALEGALYIDAQSSPLNTGVAFNASPSSGTGFGARLYQTDPGFLNLIGNNGFSGLQIISDPNSNNANGARLQLLDTQIFADTNGLLSLRVDSNNGMVNILHNDGTLADLTPDAVNLGSSLANDVNGTAYPAIEKAHCTPNGRIAMNAQSNGALLACVNNIWTRYMVSNKYTELQSGCLFAVNHPWYYHRRHHHKHVNGWWVDNWVMPPTVFPHAFANDDVTIVPVVTWNGQPTNTAVIAVGGVNAYGFSENIFGFDRFHDHATQMHMYDQGNQDTMRGLRLCYVAAGYRAPGN